MDEKEVIKEKDFVAEPRQRLQAISLSDEVRRYLFYKYIQLSRCLDKLNYERLFDEGEDETKRAYFIVALVSLYNDLAPKIKEKYLDEDEFKSLDKLKECHHTPESLDTNEARKHFDTLRLYLEKLGITKFEIMRLHPANPLVHMGKYKKRWWA